MPVGVEILDRPGRNTGIHRRLCHAQGHFRDQPRVERFGDQVIGAEAQLSAAVSRSDFLVGLFHDQVRQGFDAGNLHCLVDVGCTYVQGAAKHVREHQHVVDLVWIIGAARTDDRVGPHFVHQFRHYLRLGIRQRHDERAIGHALDLLRLENPRCGQSQEHIGAVDHVVEGAGDAVDRIALLVRVHVVAAEINDAIDVAEGHVFLA